MSMSVSVACLVVIDSLKSLSSSAVSEGEQEHAVECGV
jgi:hypothetical protein